jgi:hypothetical protein
MTIRRSLITYQVIDWLLAKHEVPILFLSWCMFYVIVLKDKKEFYKILEISNIENKNLQLQELPWNKTDDHSTEIWYPRRLRESDIQNQDPDIMKRDQLSDLRSWKFFLKHLNSRFRSSLASQCAPR